MRQPVPDATTISDYLRPSIAALPASLIREVTDQAMGLEGLIPLWFGEPDVPTPEFICAAAASALAAGDTFYQPNAGIRPLREALTAYMNRLYGTALGVEHVIVSVPAMNALMVVMQSLVDPGDGVVTTTPSWPNLPAAPEILGGDIRRVPLTATAAGWQLDLDRLFAACDERTRVIFLNSPNNPTGWMMSAEQQAEVLAFARQRGIWIVSDEVYARIVYDRPVAPSFVQCAAPDDRVIVVNSFSKSWAMTGWRLGWITAPPALGRTFEKLTEFNIAGAAGFIQQGGVAAVQEGEAFVADTVARYGRARDLVVERGAGQFRLADHALCWVHAERLVHKLTGFNDDQRRAVDITRELIWWLYRDLKLYKDDPCRQRAAQLKARFKRIFSRKTEFVTLDRLLARLLDRMDEFLRVLDRPEIPLL